MSENMELSTKLENKAVIEYLSETFPENERKSVMRDLFIVSQIKSITTREKVMQPNGFEKFETVKRKMTIYESMAYVMLCKQLNFNSALDLVTMLEDKFYIGLEGHRAYAHSTGMLRGIDAELVAEREVEYIKTEWIEKKKQSSSAVGKQYEYKCIVKKQVGDLVIEFKGIGIADPSNVAGGDNVTDLKLRQMAEARSKRRALSDAFPPGVPHIEDVYEYPDYQLPEPVAKPALPEDSDRFKKKPASVESQATPAVASEPEKPAPDPAPKPTPAAKPKPAPKPPMNHEPEDPDDADAMSDEEYTIRHDNGKIPSRTIEKKIEPKIETKNEPVGIDQINRIGELCKILGYSEDLVDLRILELENRDEANKAIGTLVAKVAEFEGKAKADAGTKTSAVKNLRNKSESEYESIKKDPRFVAAFGSDTGKTEGPDPDLPEETEAQAEEMQDDVDILRHRDFITEEFMGYLESLDEPKLRSALSIASEEFKRALRADRTTPSPENANARSSASDLCAKINQTIIKKGYGVK